MFFIVSYQVCAAFFAHSLIFVLVVFFSFQRVYSSRRRKTLFAMWILILFFITAASCVQNLPFSFSCNVICLSVLRCYTTHSKFIYISDISFFSFRSPLAMKLFQVKNNLFFLLLFRNCSFGFSLGHKQSQNSSCLDFCCFRRGDEEKRKKINSQQQQPTRHTIYRNGSRAHTKSCTKFTNRKHHIRIENALTISIWWQMYELQPNLLQEITFFFLVRNFFPNAKCETFDVCTFLPFLSVWFFVSQPHWCVSHCSVISDGVLCVCLCAFFPFRYFLLFSRWFFVCEND